MELVENPLLLIQEEGGESLKQIYRNVSCVLPHKIEEKKYTYRKLNWILKWLYIYLWNDMKPQEGGSREDCQLFFCFQTLRK